MPPPEGSRSFYVALDAGELDTKLDEVYTALLSQGETFQATEVAERAMDAALDTRLAKKWSGRLAQRLDERAVLDEAWLPDRLLPRYEPATPKSGAVLGIFKASLPHSLAGYTVRTQQTLEAQQMAGFSTFPCTPVGFGGTLSEESVRSVTYRRLQSDDDSESWTRSESLEGNAHALFGVATEVSPSLLHGASGFYGPDMGLVGLAVARAIGVPFVYEMRGMLAETWNYQGDLLKHQRQRSWMRWNQEVRVAREAAAVVTIGDSLKRELIAAGIHQDKVFVVPNGVDTDAFAIKSAGSSDTPPTIGYVSNLGEREGHLLLVDAMAILRARGVDVRCLIVGDGPMRGKIEGKVRSLGLTNRVRLTGSVPHGEVAEHYAMIDLFVVPRLDDRAARYTTPLKPYEAMAMGIPLVVSDLPALREIVGDGERGATFHCGSSESLADVVGKVLGNPTYAARLAQTAHGWVLKERKWEDNASRYRAAFDYAITAHPLSRQ